MSYFHLNYMSMLTLFPEVISCSYKVKAFASTDGIIPNSQSLSLSARIGFNQLLFLFKLTLGQQRTFLDIFMNKPDLTVLNLSFQNIGPKLGLILAISLQKNSSIRSLELEGNYICAPGAQSLAGFLQHNPSITSLTLGHNSIGDFGSQALAFALLKNSSITSLDLSWNEIGDFGSQALAFVLQQHLSITELNLNDNQIGKTGAHALFDAMSKNRTITEISLGGNLNIFYIQQIGNISKERRRRLKSQLSSIAAQHTAAFASTNRLIPSSQFPSGFNWMDFKQHLLQSDLTPELHAIFLDVFKNKSDLTALNLCNHQIGLNGFKYLALALQQNSSITKLHLHSNNIGDDGAIALATALQHNSSITYLHLGYNNIGPVGAQALLDVLDTNTTITTLDLRNTLSAKHNIRKTIDTILRQRNNQLLTSQPSTSVSQLTSASTSAPAVKSSSITRSHPHPTFSPHTLFISSPTHYTPGSKLQKGLKRI